MSFNDSDGAIREGEPPIFPRSRRDSRKDALSFHCLLACAFGLLTAVGVLFVAIMTPISFSLAKTVFVLALLIAFTAAGLLLQSSRYWGIAGILAVLILIVLSFVPIYAEHVGEPRERRSHRHMLWWPDHIH